MGTKAAPLLRSGPPGGGEAGCLARWLEPEKGDNADRPRAPLDPGPLIGYYSYDACNPAAEAA
jgi:hypothetical protein